MKRVNRKSSHHRKAKNAAENRRCSIVDCVAENIPMTDWFGHEKDRASLDGLQVGECVRLILCDPTDFSYEEKASADPFFRRRIGWEKIYFEILRIDTFREGNIHRPRKITGRAMDTYRLYPSDQLHLPFINTGETLSFQRRHVMEVPHWHSEDAYRKQIPEQPKVSEIEASREWILVKSRELFDYNRAREKERKSTLKKKITQPKSNFLRQMEDGEENLNDTSILAGIVPEQQQQQQQQQQHEEGEVEGFLLLDALSEAT